MRSEGWSWIQACQAPNNKETNTLEDFRVSRNKTLRKEAIAVSISQVSNFFLLDVHSRDSLSILDLSISDKDFSRDHLNFFFFNAGSGPAGLNGV